MKQFFGGILTASIFWAGLLFAQANGVLTLFDLGGVEEAHPDPTSVATMTVASEDEGEPKRRRGRRSGGRRRTERQDPMPARQYDESEGVSGDDLSETGAREIEMGGSGREDQLSEAEIDRGVDRVFNGIQRCLLMLPADAPATGRVVFGMHIAPNGQVLKVNLKGPTVMITGDCGACFRRTIKSIRFPGFDGPDMIAHYPVVFE